MVNMVKTWKFAVTTPQGIYQGELTGEQEPGETDVHAMQAAAAVARAYIESYQPGVIILACFVSDSALVIDAPGTTLINIDVETEIHIEDAGQGMSEEEQAIQCAREQAPRDIIATPVEVTGARLHKKMNVTGDDLIVHGKRWYILVELRNMNRLSDEYNTKATALYRVWPDAGQLKATRVELYSSGINELEIDNGE